MLKVKVMVLSRLSRFLIGVAGTCLLASQALGRGPEQYGVQNGEDAVHLINEFAKSPEWLSLMYYESAGDHFKSRVTAPLYFANQKTGAVDPKSELQSNIELFTQTMPASEAHPQCRYPARYQILQRHFKLALPVHCQKLADWYRSYAPQSIKLVYASQFISNPASVFGHTFLLIPSATQSEGFWLTYNYAAAIPPDATAFGYIFGGLTGWYVGDFSIMPFYQRLFQYGSVENRDLWVYDLKMNAEEQALMISHLWELVHTARFNYYFLDENCAGVLLRAFAAILPDMRGGNSSFVYVHPFEVLRHLNQNGRLGEAKFIPSQTGVLRNSYLSLNSVERSQFQFALANPNSSLEALDAHVSETLIQYLVYLGRKNGDVIPLELQGLDRAAHIRRSMFHEPPIEYPMEQSKFLAPHLAHDSAALEAGSQIDRGRASLLFGYRFAIHDILDPEAGFLKNSSVEFFKAQLAATANSVDLERLVFVNVENHPEAFAFDRSLSWKFNSSIRNDILSDELHSRFFQTEGGVGYSISLQRQALYGLLDATANWGGAALSRSPYEVGPEIGAILSAGVLRDRLSLELENGVFSSRNRLHFRASNGFSIALSQRWTLLQETEWQHLWGLGGGTERDGLTASLIGRYYF
jgi:hypothetical protein